MKKIVIAIDGYSSCGKSTFAKLIAKKFGYIFIDTGAMYRAITLYAIRNNLIINNILNNNALEEELKNIIITFKYDNNEQKSFVYLNTENVEDQIRGIEVSNYVSLVSQNKAVRELLVALQQEMGENKAVVMDGRDIGTTVFPHAELKIFMTASVSVRAKRRYSELIEKGDVVSLDDIMKNIQQRDYQDENRKVSPLRKADDALVLDNDNLTIEQQMTWITDKINYLIKG